MPNITALMKNGSFSPLKSTIPPITVPAWMSMVTGKDPGQLGLYGFQNRLDRSYKNLMIPNASMVRSDTIWQTLSKFGFSSLIIGVPLTYPPKPFKGNIITSFLTPSLKSNYTFPKSLKYEISSWVHHYLFDVENLRTTDKKIVLRDVYEMTKKRFDITLRLLNNKEWDFFMMVEMGIDRMHHAFWAHHDQTHAKHDPKSPFIDSIFKYYRYVDKKIGELLKIIPKDTHVLIVSDHGVQKMKGGIAINDWLIGQDLLKLKQYPVTPMRIESLIAEDMIDWA
ncbi:MAG: alkaline phosphatase family protein, partial [Thermotogota bacterium]